MSERSHSSLAGYVATVSSIEQSNSVSGEIVSLRVAGARLSSLDSGRHAAHRLKITLLSSFELLCDGRPVSLPVSTQRLVAFLALHEHQLLRPYVAGALWLESSEDRAAANLRSSLWRLNQRRLKVVEGANGRIGLASGVQVDLRESSALAHALLAGRVAEEVTARAMAALSGDVLPDWYDDWIVMERERFRQLRLHALEAISELLLAEGDFGRAIETAQEAAVAEPLRESAHRLLIRIHLAEGNPGEALRQFGLCKRLFREQLAVSPSPETSGLVAHLTP